MKPIIFLVGFLLFANSAQAQIIEDEKAWYQLKDFILPSGLIYRAKELIQIKTARAEELPLQIQIQNWLNSRAEKYGLNKKIFIGVAKCESKFIINAKGDFRSETGEYMAAGIFQFWEKTFNLFREESGMTKLKYDFWQDQVELAGWAFANEKANHWYNCYRFVNGK